MKIYDCFNFFNELDLLEIRLNELNDIVDYFVIVESEKTHQNESKPLYYNELRDDERFKKFKEKIINVIVSGDEFTNDTWYNEKHQFNCINRGLDNTNDEDLIILGAADEIPKNHIIHQLKETYDNGLFVLMLKFYYFYLDTKYEHSNQKYWKGNCVIKKKYLSDNLYETLKLRQAPSKVIEDGGWHFSFMGDVKNAIKKINSYAHNEFRHISENDMSELFEKLEDPLGRYGFSKFYAHEPLTELPTHVQKNLENYKKYLHQFK
jgi:beta-1,4-mannosyl-glycoprotein beta-1,4-N-acetylglucosaminyltransferase